MSKSITKNFLYNVLLQIVTLIMPLITVPYVSRVLGKEGMGIYGYTGSIVQYFVILGTIGISLYGNRSIAYVRDDKDKMSKTFWSIYLLNLITTSIAFIVYLIIYGFDMEYGYVYLLQSINIAASMVDISWLYMGLEDFKKTVTRNIFVKVLGVICVFIFVKSADDLELYVAIYALMIFLGNAVMWMYLPKCVNRVKITFGDIMQHLIPTLQLFVPQIAIQVYAVLDKTMLGKLADVGEVGLYEQSQKIIRIVLALVTSLGVVMLPRMSNTYANGDKETMNRYLNNICNIVIYISIPMAFGLAGISNEFVPWFFGEEFNAVSYLMVTMTPILVFIALSNVFGMQYLMPVNKTREFTASVTCGAIINVCINIILIPRYRAVGACISTVVAEFTVTFIQYLFVRKLIKKKIFALNAVKYLFASIIMLIIVKLIGRTMGVSILTTIVQSLCGMIIYFVILAVLKDSTNKLLFKTAISKIKSIGLKVMKADS